MRKGGHRTHPNLKDAAVDYIRDRIIGGAFVPGGKVDQDDIAATLGISRLPVREALIELAQEGFVEAIPRRGAFVVTLAVDDIHDHYRAYGAVAGLAAARCAERVDDATLADLRRLHDAVAEADDPVRQAAANFEFHRRVHHGSGSRQLLSVLWFLGRALPIAMFRHDAVWHATAVRDHGDLLDALAQRRSGVADEVTRRHLGAAADHLVEVLRRDGYWTDVNDR